MNWEPGGSEAVTEGTAGYAQGHGEDGLSLLAWVLPHRPLHLPCPQSHYVLVGGRLVNVQALETWNGAQALATARPHQQMMLLTTPHGPQSCGVHPAPYLVGVIFLHSSLAVILVGQEMESRDVSIPPPPIHCLAQPGRAREIGLG